MTSQKQLRGGYWRAKSEILQNNGKKEERMGRREGKGRLPWRLNYILNYRFGESEQQKHLSSKGVQFSFAAHGHPNNLFV